MTSGKYSKVLTILLIVAIVGVVGILIFIGIDVYNKYYLEKEANQGVAKFDELIPDVLDGETTNNVPIVIDNTTNNTTNNTIDPYANIQDNTNNSNENDGKEEKVIFKGFVQEGTISIPSTGAKYPVLEKATKNALEVAVAIQTGPGLNKPGNTVIAGHNYRDGTLFSDNEDINLGDKISIKDTSGATVTYVVYEKTEITPDDSSYITRDTGGKREVTLYSCNDDSTMRIIIKAREQE